MTARLDREGIFKARPLSWAVLTFDSGAVGINMEFAILAQLDGAEWVSWAEAEDHHVYGTFFVVLKDGTVNARNVEDLYRALGWEGSMAAIAGPVPDRVVQVTVKLDDYKGKRQYKAEFINPEDFVPGPQGATADEVKRLDARFGSLLRAAAAGAKRATGGKQAPPPPPKASGKHAAPTTGVAANPISGAPLDDLPMAFDRGATLRALLEESIRANVKRAADTMGFTLTKASDLDALSDEQLQRLSDAVFDAAIPF